MVINTITYVLLVNALYVRVVSIFFLIHQVYDVIFLCQYDFHSFLNFHFFFCLNLFSIHICTFFSEIVWHIDLQAFFFYNLFFEN